jgi:hypothetical protein
MAGAEVPATNGTVWVVLVQRRPVPRCQFERAERLGIGAERLGIGAERLGIGAERLGGKRSDLVDSFG